MKEILSKAQLAIFQFLLLLLYISGLTTTVVGIVIIAHAIYEVYFSG